VEDGEGLLGEEGELALEMRSEDRIGIRWGRRILAAGDRQEEILHVARPGEGGGQREAGTEVAGEGWWVVAEEGAQVAFEGFAGALLAQSAASVHRQ